MRSLVVGSALLGAGSPAMDDGLPSALACRLTVGVRAERALPATVSQPDRAWQVSAESQTSAQVSRLEDGSRGGTIPLGGDR